MLLRAIRRPILVAAALLAALSSPARAQDAGVGSATAKPAAASRGKPSKRARKLAAYQKSVKRWHATAQGKSAAVDELGRPLLVLESINTRESLSLSADGDEGGFSESEIERASELLRDPRTSQVKPVDPELLDLVYRIQCHFEAHAIRVVSAYRAPSGPRESRHAQGKALDIIVPGATDHAVAAYVRKLGSHGVGLYPRSGFVHVDVRETSHYWVDNSGPGQTTRARAPKKSKKRPRKSR